MTGHFVLRSTTLAAAFLLFATGAANAACSIDEASVSPTTDEVLPTMRPPPQEFSFVATGACRNLVFSVEGSTLTKTPTTAGTGYATPREYTVVLTGIELSSVADESTTTLTWSVTAYGSRGRAIAHVTTTNELDFDADGWTRSDGDGGECDLSDTINPGVEEICNDVDDNCSGGVDECIHAPIRFCRITTGGPCSYQCIDGDYTVTRGSCPSLVDVVIAVRAP